MRGQLQRYNSQTMVALDLNTVRTLLRLAGFSLLMFCLGAPAYETDQFTQRRHQIADSQSLLNQKVNLAIGDSILGITDPDSSLVVVNRIYHRLGGLSSVDKIESWAMHSDEIERLPISDDTSIYSEIPIWATRVAGFAGVGATIKVNGVLMGTDKLGHFISQGRKFYLRWLGMQNVEEAAQRSALTENAIFGKLSTGSYSNADLVANYEGFRFYRSLFEPDHLTGKAPILVWKNDHWAMQRPFEWADYVNDYWDEALNINQFDRVLYPYMKERLLELCDWYELYSHLYQLHNEAELKKRYEYLQLKDTSELRFSNLCSAEASSINQSGSTGSR